MLQHHRLRVAGGESAACGETRFRLCVFAAWREVISRKGARTQNRIRFENDNDWRESMRLATALLLLFTAVMSSLAQGPQSERQQFIRVEAPVVALAHV